MIYVASKTKHAPRWRALRAIGWPINSSWIDEAGPGDTADFGDLWVRCINEASKADAVLLYREPGDVLKGAFIEVGAALACGKPVYAVGCREFSFVNHPRVLEFFTLIDALRKLSEVAMLAGHKIPTIDDITLDEDPMSFFRVNVDKWGAAEWFDRLENAVSAHDRARVADDHIMADTYKMIMTSSAFRLARDYGDEVRAALAGREQ